MLRKDYTEPRIHFALVCASIGCPALRKDVFTADRLNEQLNDATKQFLKDKDRNYVDDGSNTMHLSSIFKWFKEDFAKKAGSVENFVAPWITDDKQLQQKIRDDKMDITYLDYDWNLNRAK